MKHGKSHKYTRIYSEHHSQCAKPRIPMPGCTHPLPESGSRTAEPLFACQALTQGIRVLQTARSEHQTQWNHR
jgi:hypothetical protein